MFDKKQYRDEYYPKNLTRGAEDSRLWRLRHPEKAKRGSRERTWIRNGIKNIDAARFLWENRHGCTICGATDVDLTIDHDHITGMVRGTLCHRCNRALGIFEDNIDLMERAIEYLRNPPSLEKQVVMKPELQPNLIGG